MSQYNPWEWENRIEHVVQIFEHFKASFISEKSPYHSLLFSDLLPASSTYNSWKKKEKKKKNCKPPNGNCSSC